MDVRNGDLYTDRELQRTLEELPPTEAAQLSEHLVPISEAAYDRINAERQITTQAAALNTALERHRRDQEALDQTRRHPPRR